MTGRTIDDAMKLLERFVVAFERSVVLQETELALGKTINTVMEGHLAAGQRIAEAQERSAENLAVSATVRSQAYKDTSRQ